jgi:predicted RNA binding protein YcfA (HicA-like mRNA interferase family)
LNVKEILKLLKEDGWYLVRTKGAHKQFKHHTKKGLVTVSAHNLKDEIAPKTLYSILTQAGLR